MSASASQPPRRLLVVVPNWVGDVVLATPALAALRAGLPDAQITYLMRPYVAEVVAGGGWHDAHLYWATPAAPKRPRVLAALRRERDNARRVARARALAFDAVLLLTNSFRSAAFAWLAGIPRRVGYARDGRGWMLTDRLRPRRAAGRFVPTSVVDSYAALAERLGCPVADSRRPRLGVTPQQEQAGRALQRHYGLAAGQYAVINPGAAFGAAKCWLPERFAELCDRLRAEHDLVSVIVGGPNEAPLMRAIANRAASRPLCCLEPGTTLGSLKPLIRDAALLVCNDTGPRHYGIAFGVPTLTIFGPTHQEWTAVDAPRELRLQAQVPCGPCQLRTCPLDHRCMHAITVDAAAEAAQRLLATGRRPLAPETTVGTCG